MSKEVASISCRCGNVQIQFSANKPRLSTECCCNHCYNRVVYLEKLGGPTVPDRPLLNSKWDNCFTVIQGREHLYCFKLNEETLVYNIASRCCHTFLLGRHAGYDAHCVTTASDFPIWHNADLPFEASSRWFSNQWEPARLAKYPPLIGIWVNEESEANSPITGDPGWEPVLEQQIAIMNQEIENGICGETFDSLVDSIGRDKIIIATPVDAPLLRFLV